MASRGSLQLVHAARSFSTGPLRLAPPVVKKAAKGAGPKTSMYAKRKTVDEDVGPATASALSEATLPAPDLSGIAAFQPETLVPAALGQLQAFPDSTLAAFKTFTIPVPLQREFAYSKRPATVVRRVTLALANQLDSHKSTSSSAARYILDGAPGSGKSVALLQTVSYALSTKWIVLYLPSATPLINSSTPHVYSSQQAIFQQPVISSLLLQRFASVNKAAFKTLKTSRSWNLADKTVAAGENLGALVALGSNEKVSASVLEALMDELAAQTSFPVLLAIDDVQGLFATSSYIDPNYYPLESYSLSVPRLLLDYISGAKAFTHGSILLAHSPLSSHLSPALQHHLAGTTAPPSIKEDVYPSILAGLTAFPMPARLERKEAVGVVEMLQVWRGAREPVSDRLFLERFVATDGNVREFAKSLGRNAAD